MDIFGRGGGDEPVEADDSLALEELTPKGGSWSGLLFDNPAIGLQPQLTWTFEIDFEEVERDYGSTSPGLTIDWVPLPRASWLQMAGAEASGREFADPIESSFYFFEHHRYDSARVQIADQRDERIKLMGKVEGDTDGLGIPEISVSEWLPFAALTVQLSGVDSLESATSTLGTFTDACGLAGEMTRSGVFRFLPIAGD